MSKATLNALLFVMISAFWGGSFVAIKVVVEQMPPVFGAMLRVGVALTSLTLLFRATKKSTALAWPQKKIVWIAGVFSQGLPFALLFWGEQRISPGLAGILNGTVPLWTFLLGWIFLGHLDTFSPSKLAGLLLSISGLVIIFGPLLHFGKSEGALAGSFAVFLMAVSYGVGTLLTRSLLAGTKIDFRANALHQHVASFVFLVVLSLAFEKWPTLTALSEQSPALLAVLYLGICSTAIAMLVYYHLIREWGAIRASAVTYVVPVVAMLWDFIFFSNLPSQSQVFGTALILAGVVLVQYSGWRQNVRLTAARAGQTSSDPAFNPLTPRPKKT